MIRIALAIWTCLTAAALGASASRQELSLNGRWEHRLVDDLSAPAPEDGFTPVSVPGYLSGIDHQRAWFRRKFTVPADMQGMRIKIRFGGVKYNSRVYVNGREVGGSFGGHRPFEVDVTEAVRFDGPNDLAVGCHDWTGLFTPGKVDFKATAEWHRVRSAPQDKILAPIGGLYGLYGIWDDVTLQAHPAVYVKDLFIKPSVRRGELVVDYTVSNESAAEVEVELRATVEDESNDALDLPSARVRVPAGGTATASLRKPWPEARRWSHVDPYLYHLRTELSSGDVLRTRFGFREFWVEGPHFYLNGTRVNLLATSWWPPHAPMTREEIKDRWEAVKLCGCVAFRTHTQPWRSVHYDVADELGLLMIVEGAVWNDESVYRINDPVFWQNYAGHLEAMVNRGKNRATRGVAKTGLEARLQPAIIKEVARKEVSPRTTESGRSISPSGPRRISVTNVSQMLYVAPFCWTGNPGLDHNCKCCGTQDLRQSSPGNPRFSRDLPHAHLPWGPNATSR
ncbi:MAG: sugar-binding domain-containing protein [Planctomycetota bacterium]